MKTIEFKASILVIDRKRDQKNHLINNALIRELKPHPGDLLLATIRGEGSRYRVDVRNDRNGLEKKGIRLFQFQHMMDTAFEFQEV